MTFADIAVPVPLRRTFTYRVPQDLDLSVGMRVAVPFSGRKLPGIALRLHDEPPEGVKRVLKVAGTLEADPVFPQELLSFLLDAALYYLHPVGEVLRAAAPAMPKEALKALREGGFLEDEGELKGARMATKRTLKVRRLADVEPPARLGSRQRQVLALLDERGELLLTELNQMQRGARSVVKALADKGLVATEECEVALDPFFRQAVDREQPLPPTEAQSVAIERLTGALHAGQGGTFLLHGVTGSGKTEVYLQLVAEALERGDGALVLVPEIALTPQLVGRFRARFGEGIAVLHSGLSDRERHEAWRALRKGSLRLAIGARSALFAPVPKLGVVIVDEEHDPSFKQEDGFRYHGRDMAVLRAHRASAVCVLGSATPSLESYQLVERGKATLLELPSRAMRQQMPSVEVVDLTRNSGRGPLGHPLITGPLYRGLESCLADGDQAILFLNRRGFSPSLRCESCTALIRCPACSVSLTEHRRAGMLRCHYCDYTTPMTTVCPECRQPSLQPMGIGTERVEEALQTAFPDARVGRLDRDTAAGRGVEEVLDRMRRRELDVLVGTQMVTKGHDLPGVTLVGVLLADQGLAFPDFRASERTFQLLAQVAGRAGRGERAGRVVLQTYQPDHPAVRFALAHDYAGFYRAEIAARQELDYAPFSRLVAVRADAGDEEAARRAIGELAQVVKADPGFQQQRVALLGPASAPIARLRGRYRMRFLLRSGHRVDLRRIAAAVAARIDAGVSPARASVDVDPVSML